MADSNYEDIDGGNVEGIDLNGPTWDDKRHKSITAARLAWTLVGFFAIAVVGHYSTLVSLYLTGHESAAEKMSTNFNILFPVLAGFVGSAMTYYFTRAKEF